ncbi:MCE family protein [Mycolicibacterium sphagni]|uniref:MCE family protein n=1 Tax=Mycolicibacterium sphagni TaxID=1786 RepID=UPI0021F27969|nr:MCE family protein [Mycolicibacterium sphagni]MCV7177060.1 MCE family protein [Mycolicibacterium sphagni]
MSALDRSRAALAALLIIGSTVPVACDWRGANSLPLPGTAGHGPGSYEIQAQLADVTNIQPNSRVRVDDVTVGTVTKIQRQGWHALVTMSLDGNVVLPANATATVGQTSLLGSLHIELAPPVDAPPQGRLGNGSLIPLAHSAAYPTTEQTLSVASMLLNGGGLGQIQDITKAFSVAFAGREDDLRNVIVQLDQFIGHLDQQKSDIIAANESINRLAGQFADQKPVMDRALHTIPDALVVLKEQRDNLVTAVDQLGKFNALAADSAHQTKDALAKEFDDLGPVLQSLADAGPALTRSLSLISTYPWPKENVTKFFRGDAANITMVIDMTLSRLDSSFFTGTRWEGNLTELEMQWGRTIGQLPSPVTSGNPLVVPYHLDQGP